jgi:DNA-binding PadR family transcriptional regulator
MCLLARGANTGNGLVRLLREFPVGGHGQSPGAVYPALRRLEDAEFVQHRLRKRGRRWLCGRSKQGYLRRYYPRKRQREYVLTYRGIAELRRWAREPVTRADLLERPDFLLLRFAMVPGLLGPVATQRFLGQYARIAREVTEDTRRYVERFAIDSVDATRDMSANVRLAFDLTIDVLDARARWAWRASRGAGGRPPRGPPRRRPPPRRLPRGRPPAGSV